MKNGCLMVLRSAALICGEFANLVKNPINLAKILLNKKNNFLPEDTVAVFLQNALKLFAVGIKGFFYFIFLYYLIFSRF